MIELLLVAAAYGVIFSPSSESPRRPGARRTMFAPGCFRDLLDHRPPVLLEEHRGETVLGSMHWWADHDDRLELVMRSTDQRVVGPAVAGWVCFASPGWQTLDDEYVEDDEGSLRVIHLAHLQELSLCRTPALRLHRPIAWRAAP